MTTTALAPMEVKEVADFAVFQQGEELTELLTDNLGDESFSPGDLTRIKVPAGGGTTFEIPTPKGEIEVKEIEAVVLKVAPVRLYWKQGFDEAGGEGTPPDCRSDDLIHGHGDPGGECASCPMNQWPEDGSRKAKPCSERRIIYVLPPTSLLPYALSCPVKSIGNWKSYCLALSSAGVSVYKTTTVISLKKEKNNNGISYSQLSFRQGRPLTPEQTAMVKAYRDSFSGVLQGAPANGGNGGAPAPDFGNM